MQYANHFDVFMCKLNYYSGNLTSASDKVCTQEGGGIYSCMPFSTRLSRHILLLTAQFDSNNSVDAIAWGSTTVHHDKLIISRVICEALVCGHQLHKQGASASTVGSQ